MTSGVYIRTAKNKRNISRSARERWKRSEECKQEIKSKASQRAKKRYEVKGRKENLRRFSITLQDYNRILKFQKGRCGICKCKPSQVKYRFAVDHDHKTGMIRGLLCVSCNHKLGWFEIHKKESEQYLRNVKNIQRVIR